MCSHGSAFDKRMNPIRKFRILIVCPDPTGLALLTSMLKSLDYLIEEAATDRLAVRLMERNPINLVLASVDPGDAKALELLSYVRRKYPVIPVVLMFPRVHPERVKEALRLGAMAVLKYPVPAVELRAAVLQALEHCESQPQEMPAQSLGEPLGAVGVARPMPAAQPQAQPASIALAHTNGLPSLTVVQGIAPAGAFPTTLPIPAPSPVAEARPTSHTRAESWARDVNLVTANPGLKQIVELANTLASLPSSVLIVGEPGTGKSMLAQFIHLSAGQTDRPFITLKANELEEADADSHENESDTRATDPTFAMTAWSSKLELARGGTLYIEEVGALPTDIQLPLLRELQLYNIEAAAGPSRSPGRPGARFILSTSNTLAASVEQGSFHPELYYRISTLCLMVPPLRHRGSDIELLAEHFRAGFAQEFRNDVVGFTQDALEALQRHDWPGNVRELKGVIQRAVARCSGPRITSTHLAPILNYQRQSRGGTASSSRPHLPTGIRPLKEALQEPEKRIIIQALQALNWNRQEAARILNINRTTLYKKIKKYNIVMV